MKTPAITPAPPTTGKHQQPMGFGEFNHCIDILMQSLSEASLQCLTASQSGYNTKAAADMAFSY